MAMKSHADALFYGSKLLFYVVVAERFDFGYHHFRGNVAEYCGCAVGKVDIYRCSSFEIFEAVFDSGLAVRTHHALDFVSVGCFFHFYVMIMFMIAPAYKKSVN